MEFMFEDDRDPTTCAIFYLAMRKKRLWQNMWKMAAHHLEQPAMVKFLADDFGEPRWRAAALKKCFRFGGQAEIWYFSATCLQIYSLTQSLRVCNCLLSFGRSSG